MWSWIINLVFWIDKHMFHSIYLQMSLLVFAAESSNLKLNLRLEVESYRVSWKITKKYYSASSTMLHHQFANYFHYENKIEIEIIKE